MKRNAMGWVMLLTAGLLALVAGCGSPDNSSDALDGGFVTGMDYVYENLPPDLSSSSVVMTAIPTYLSSIASTDIDSIRLNDGSGSEWDIAASGLNTSSFGTGTVSLPLSSRSNPHTFPLGTTWTIEIKLKNGRTSAIRGPLREPGTLNVATHSFMYSAEDGTPTNPADFVALLGRFPTDGVSFTYAADNGGTVTSNGFAAAQAAYVATQPNAYNLSCDLFDVNGQYLANTFLQYRKTDHGSTGLIGSNGEISFTAALTSNSSLVLSSVKYIRIICVDGAQFQSLNPGAYQMKSYSMLIPVQ